MRDMQCPLDNNMITISLETAFLNLTPHISFTSPESEERFLGLDFCSCRGSSAGEVVAEGRTHSDGGMFFRFGTGPEGGKGERACEEGLTDSYETVNIDKKVGDEEND